MTTLIVTRHPALVELINERGMVPVRFECRQHDAESTECTRYCDVYQLPDCRVLDHVTAADVRGQHVIGVLPLHLAAECASVTEIPLALTPADRVPELGLERLRQIAGPAVTYTVRRTEALRCAIEGVVEKDWYPADQAVAVQEIAPLPPTKADAPCPECGERPGEENEYTSCSRLHRMPVR